MSSIGLLELKYQSHNLGSVDLKFLQHTFLDTLSVQFCVFACTAVDIFEACKNLELSICIDVILKT